MDPKPLHSSAPRERRHLWSRVRVFFRFALRRETAARAGRVACAITPILTLLNHSREILALQLGPAFWTQAALTFCVPYCVATYSAAMAAIAEYHRLGLDPYAADSPARESGSGH